MRRHTRQPAFTLVEMVMTCVLLSILALLITPRISDYYAHVKLKGLSRQIVGDVRLCRQLAISRRVTHWVVFDVSGNSYALYEEQADLPGKENRVPLTYPSAASDAEHDIGMEYPGLELSSVNIAGQSEIGFDLLGTAVDTDGERLTSDGSIVIKDQAGRQSSVSIASLTGKAYLE